MDPITIVIPVYNGERFLPAAIDSALAQTTAARVLVVDDGSSDGTENVIRSYGDQISCISKPNGGTSSAWNAALSWCESDYLLGLDSDDELERVAVEALLDSARTMPEADIVYSDYCFTDSHGAVVRPVENPEPTAPVAQLLRLHDRLGEPDNFVPFGHARLYRRDTLLRHRGYDETYLQAEDYELLLRMALGGARFVRCPRTLYRYRWHEENKGVRKRSEQVEEVRRAVRELMR